MLCNRSCSAPKPKDKCHCAAMEQLPTLLVPEPPPTRITAAAVITIGMWLRVWLQRLSQHS
eukprot:1673950-Amphidinium_carterae.1